MSTEARSPLTRTPNADLKVGRVFRYEVLAFADKRWLIDSVIEGEAPAIARARELLDAAKADEVKVVRQRTMSTTGFTTESTIFQEARAKEKKGEIQLSASIDKAPLCATAGDLAGLEARIILNRLLREFLDRHAITPTELVWDFAHLKRLQNQDNLLMAAIHHIARAQVQGQGAKGPSAKEPSAGDRARALETIVNEAIATARDAQLAKKKLPPFDPADFDGFRRAVDARFPEAERHVMTMVRLAEYLGEGRGWEHKLLLAAALVRDDLSPDALSLVDGIVADVLGVGQMVQDMLGQQPSFAAALQCLGDLILGRVGEGAGVSEGRQVVARLITRLPDSRRVLIDRLVRELKSDKPLGRNDPEAERDKLAKLKERMRDGSGALIGGAEAEAAFEARRIALRKMLLRRMGLEG
jgi:hypothetical protein